MTPLVIGIAGGTGSGKTTIAAKLAAAIPAGRCAVIDHDSYYHDQSALPPAARDQVNYDHPSSLESTLLAAHLAELRAGRAVEVPRFDYATHTRRADTRRVEPSPVVIVEGILVFVEPIVREQLDIKLFVDTDPDIRLMRRICRDLQERGYSFEHVRDQYYATVRPMHLEFVEPSKRHADLVIPEGGDNRVAIELILGRLGQIAFG